MTTDNYYFLVILVVLVAVAAVLFVWLRRDRTLPGADRNMPQVPTEEAGAPPPAADDPGMLASAAETVIEPIIAPPVDPSIAEAIRAAIPDEPAVSTAIEAAPADTLTTLKGLGPKAAARLNELGIVRFDQLAALSGEALAAVDAQMGPLQGRIAKDRWVEQAGYLASGDRAGFEATFGKIGG